MFFMGWVDVYYICNLNTSEFVFKMHNQISLLLAHYMYVFFVQYITIMVVINNTCLLYEISSASIMADQLYFYWEKCAPI